MISEAFNSPTTLAPIHVRINYEINKEAMLLIIQNNIIELN